MTLGARRDRHIGFQTAQRCGFGDVDVAGRTFRDMLFLLTPTIVYELWRDSKRRFFRSVRRRELMTAVAVAGDWLLRFPVTVETRTVTCRRRLEHRRARRVADSAAVDHILVSVVRKFDRKLKFPRGVSKRKPRFVARRRLRVTDRTDRRPRTAEELRPVTAYTRIVAGIIRDVRERRYFGPIFTWELVTCIAGCFVFGCGMGKLGIISRG